MSINFSYLAIVALGVIITLVYLFGRGRSAPGHSVQHSGDPIAESDFLMAYGKYSAAADLIDAAIAAEPDRADIKMKLLEICFVWGNKDKFVASAEAFRSQLQRDEDEWSKVEIMGMQLAPDSRLFS